MTSPMVSKRQKRIMDIFQDQPSNNMESPLPNFLSSPSLTQTDDSRMLVSTNLNNTNLSKTYNDRKFFVVLVSNSVSFSGICLRIIDTPEFQRLHLLKQLGTCDFVFRSSTHTRFEHSLGVSYLAERQVKSFQQNQPELNITDIDVTCVKLAGLCHDLGHGPFSHVFDGVFIKYMYPRGIDERGTKWRHEQGSIDMFRHIISQNQIDVSTFGLTDMDMLFVEEIINGTPASLRRGRPKEKHFLYDVVNNVWSGLDVDKLDYLQRDPFMTGVAGGLSEQMVDRFIDQGKVLPVSSRDTSGSCNGATDDGAEDASPGVEDVSTRMICYPEKMTEECSNVFSCRFRMHKLVYTHKVVKAIEYMLVDALVAADPYIHLQGSVTMRNREGRYRPSEAIFDMAAMANLNDSIIHQILGNMNPLLKPAKDIIHRVLTRDLYTCIGKTPLTDSEHGLVIVRKSEDTILQEIIDIWNSSPSSTPALGGCRLTASDIIVEKVHIHHGMGKKDPVSKIYFFTKNDLQPTGRHVNVCNYDSINPKSFECRFIRVFCRHNDKISFVYEAFVDWCKAYNSHAPYPTMYCNKK